MSNDKRKKYCFVVGPIGEPSTPIRDNADMVAEFIITAALEPLGYKVERADRIPTPGTITDQIINAVLSADVVVADLTGHNANAFYELALRHMVGRPTVHLITAGERIPFDVADMRTIHYSVKNPTDIAKAREELAKQVIETEKSESELSNPVTRARGIQRLSKSEDSMERLVAEMSKQIAELGARQEFMMYKMYDAFRPVPFIANPSILDQAGTPLPLAQSEPGKSKS